MHVSVFKAGAWTEKVTQPRGGTGSHAAATQGNLRPGSMCSSLRLAFWRRRTGIGTWNIKLSKGEKAKYVTPILDKPTPVIIMLNHLRAS